MSALQKKTSLKKKKTWTGIEKAELFVHAGTQKKAKHPVLLDMRELSGVADYFVILSGQTDIQVKAIVHEIERVCKEEKITIAHIEGLQSNTWVLIDLHDVMVHVFTEQERHYYALEKLWKKARKIHVPKL